MLSELEYDMSQLRISYLSFRKLVFVFLFLLILRVIFRFTAFSFALDSWT
jgi:hypothetical protein